MLFAEPKKQNIYSKGTWEEDEGRDNSRGTKVLLCSSWSMCARLLGRGDAREGRGVMGCKDSLRRPVITSKHRGDIVIDPLPTHLERAKLVIPTV
jgi:hypothetical protein